MDATQMISDSILESDEEENEEENENKRGRPLAKLCILKNEHIPEAELPLFLGENVLGRDPNTCTLPLPAPSISKQHAAICISVYRRRGRHSEVDIEALVWDLGSMNGTRKGHLKLSPNVRYALSERDRLMVADIPCQYVSCAVDIDSSQGDTISVSRNSGVKARSADSSGEKGGDASTGAKKCVNGGTKARVSLPDLEETRKTPVRTGCLTFEQTPTQPQGTLVPESDSDSEGERGGANRRHKALVSDSDSYKSSPTCSTFMSPTNKIVRDSVDESPITPSSSTKNRPHRHVSFSKETDIDVGRQQLKEKKALVIVDDSEEEEERAALGGTKSEECSVSLTGEDESPVSTAAVAIPAFNMDSDTDVEGEEEAVVSAGPVTLNTNQQADQPPNTAQFNMDSDTDVDEDDDAIDKVPKSVPSSADNTKPPHVISVIQPEAIAMDSDTDVDDDAVVSDAASEAKPVSFQSTETADTAPSTQMKDFYLDSDTDVDEEEEKDSGTINTSSKIDETPSRLDIKSIGAESDPVAAHSLHLDSDTDDETIHAPVISEPSAASAVTKSCTAEDTGSDVDALSDSDTDDDSPLVIPCIATTLTFVPGNASEALQSDSDADTDLDEPNVLPASDGVNPADLRVDSDTDVEDEEVDFGSAGDGQIPSLQRENTPGLLVPLLQNCSTPVQGQERAVEDMDTQAFLSPSSGPFRSAVAPAVRLESLSSCSGSQEDEDFVVAETQSFVLQTRDCQGNPSEDHSKVPTRAFGPESSGDENSEQPGRRGSFHLGLSDSSHLQDQAQALAMESTQAFVSMEGGLNMEDTRPYAAISNAERTSVENDSNLEATQDYGEDEEPARCSVTSEKEGQVDLALEATQAYISEPYSPTDSEDKTDEDERKDTATQPLDFPNSSTLTMMETQPMSTFEEEESLDEENPFCSGLQVKPRPQNEPEEREEPGEDEPQARALSKALSIAETQPMHASDSEESDEEVLIPGPLRIKAQPLQPEEEQAQPFASSELALAETQPTHICADETQPMATSGNVESDVGDSVPLTNSEFSAAEGQPVDTGKDGESDEEDSIPATRKRKAKPLQLEEESQTLTNSELSAVEAQPVVTGDDGDDEEDSMPVIRKRKAKPLQLEEESQTLTNPELSAVEAQPVVTGDEEDSFPATRKRKAKPLQLEEESQTLTNSELSAVEAQPVVTGDEEDSFPATRKRKAKPLQLEEESQTLTNSDLSAVQAQPVVTGDDGDVDEEDSFPATRKRKAKPLQLEEESQTLTNSDLSAVEAQPVVKGGDGEGDDEDSVRGRRKRKAKPLQIQEEESQTVTNSEASTVETQPLETDSGLQPQRGKGGQSEAGTSGITIRGKTGTRARLREEEGQAESSEPPKRQTRGKNKALQTTRGSRGKSRPDEDEGVEQAKQARGKKSMSQPKDDENEEEADANKHAEKKKLIKKQEAGRLVEEGEEERRETEERERKQEERKQGREEQDILERKEKEEQEARNAERLRLEHERAEKETIERERKEQEEKERADRAQKDKEEQLERERKEKEEKERLEHEKAEREERERLEREENERIEKERKEQEEKARLEITKRELEERLERKRKEHQARLEREERERLEKEKQEKEQQENKEENKPKAPARGRRAARRTTTATCTTEPEQDTTISIDDDFPARRTRSRSNSSNSVNSEMSASSVSTQESSGRGRGRGAKRTSEPPRAAAARSSNRRRTVAAEPIEQHTDDIPPQGVLSRSNSNNSLNSEISSCSLNSQSRGRGGRQRGRGRRTETDSVSNSQGDPNSAPKPPTRGRKSRKADESGDAVPHGDEKKADSQQASTTRGQWRANANVSEPADEEDSSYQEAGCASEEPVPPKKNIRARGQKAEKSETVEAAPAVSDGGEAKGKGRKRDLEPNTEEESSSSFKISKGTTEAAEAKTKDETPVQAKRRGRASTSQAKKTSTGVEVNEESERMEEEIVERRGRGRPSAVQKKKIQEQEESGSSVDQDAHVEASEPQTPKSSASRKRQAPADFSPAAKTPRSSSASPAASGRLRAAGQAYKVLFTGVVDEAGERVLVRLGGSLAKGVADMNFLVTDKVRRTVKFLCAVAKGVPIVTTHWLEKSGKAGSFLSPNAFVVNDLEQEKKFNFCLQESLRIASSQPLLQGYEIHVTKSVKPEPVQMKDIITCSGATFLAKMPSSHKPQTVVISCEEDWFLCGPALAASLPVVTAEFILSGILQQKLDFQTNALSAPTSNLQPAGGKGRGRKKT